MSNAASVFSGTPVWYWIVTVAVSLYHGYRGYTLQRILVTQQREDARKASRAASSPAWYWSPCEAFVVRSLFDGLFYLLCSAVGFFSLRVLIGIFNSVANLDQISGGTATVLGLLGVVGIVGVVGQLPYLILLGKLSR